MDPVTCPMCEGAIPGKEIHILRNCPSCGADLSALVRKRLAALQPPPPPPPEPTSFMVQAAWLSLLAPLCSVAVALLGRRAVNESSAGLLVIGTVCSLIIAAGLAFGLIAFFAPKEEKTGTAARGIVGICVNALVISFVIFSLYTRQKVAASDNNSPHPRKSWPRAR